MHRLQELVRLHRLGLGPREVARLLSMSPNTERRYRAAIEAADLLKDDGNPLPELAELRATIMGEHPASAPSSTNASSIVRWQPRVQVLVKKGVGAKAIHDRLRQEEPEFSGSYDAVKRMCRRMRAAQPVRADQVAIPVESVAGDIAQVDFGYVGKLICPEQHVARRAWVFVMTLSYSRHMFAKVVFDQRSATWLQLHREAFEFFGGVPSTLVPDNLKAAVVRAAFSLDEEVGLQRSYRELARHYGFKIDPAPPYSPKKKGKVESSVKYVKRNALAGRTGERIDEVNVALQRWLIEIAGQRIHGSTGLKPIEVFAELEQSTLLNLPDKPYEMSIWKKAKVHPDAHICFDRGLYSVPWRWTGKQVWARGTPNSVSIFGDDSRIATHPRRGKSRRSTIESHLPEHRRDWRHQSRGYWERRAAAIGPNTAAFATELFDSDEVLSQLRKVQAIVQYLEGFPTPRAESASRRASFYGTYSYAGVKSILSKALDFQPLPSVPVASEPGKKPRFARNLSELVAQKLEVFGEPN